MIESFLFIGVTFLLLGTVLLGHRFFAQPIDRVRLTQLGFSLVTVLAVCLGSGVTWTIPLNHPALSGTPPQTTPTPPEEGNHHSYPSKKWEYSPPLEGRHFAQQNGGVVSPEEKGTDSPSSSPPFTEDDKEARAHQLESTMLPAPGTIGFQPASNAGKMPADPGETAVRRLLATAPYFIATLFLLPPLILLVQDFTAWRRLGRIRRLSTLPPDSAARLFDRIRGASRRRVDLRVSDEITTPIIFGMFRTTLLIPDRIISEQKLRAYIAHEWSHLKNGDLTTWNIVRMFQYVLWMQPFYWMLQRRLLSDQDYLADADAAGTCGDADDYATILYSLANQHTRNRPRTNPEIVLGMAGHKSQLRRRIDMLLNNPSPARTSSKRKLLLLFSLLTAMTLFGGILRFTAQTAEDAKEPGMEHSEIPGSEPGIAVELTDTEGNPCTTGYIRTYPDPRPADWEGDQPRNFDLEGGKAFVPISNFAGQKSFKIVLYPNGFAPYELTWPDTSREPLPTQLSFKMPEPAAQPIGGRVIDADGKPVEGAYVEFSVSLAGRQNHPGGMFSDYAQWIKTNADGYWNYQVLPQEQFEKNFDMSVTHDEYPRFRISEGQKFSDYTAKDTDGKFAIITVIPRGLPLKGRVVDEQGNPVAGVIVHTAAAKGGPSYTGDARTVTGENGEFLFENCSPTPELRTIDIGVVHNDFAPDVVALTEITPGMEPLKIVLKKGKKIVFKAVDQDGKPLEGVRISSGFWKNFWGGAVGTRQLFVDADDYGGVKTGADGRFVWENAPDNRFDLEIGHENYQNYKVGYGTLKYGDEENVYVFKPLVNVTGTVVDAETGEVIPHFSVTEWFSFKGMGGGLTREFGSQPASEGKFTRTIGHRFGEFDNYFLRIEADGYEGLQSEDLIAKSGEVSLEYKLKKATGEFATHLTGTVLLPDGTQAANVAIGVATAAYSVQTQGTVLNAPGLRQESKTDNAGNFSISRSGMSIGDQDYKLLFLHDAGTLQMSKEEFESHTGPITLQAWGRIEGTVRVGSKPLPNAPVYWLIEDRSAFDRDKAHIGIFCDRDLTADANGHYSFRIFPGQGRVGRLAAFNNGSAMGTSHAKQFDIKPGETLKIDLGGGGYIVKGRVHIPPDAPSNLDWRFGQVEARPSVAEYIAYPALSEAAKKLQLEIATAVREELSLNQRGTTASEYTTTADRLMETLKDREGFAELKRVSELASQYEIDRNYAYSRQITGLMDDKGEFQLDDLTPGNWTLEVTLNFPSVPLQWWDYADVWRKKVDITVPDFPAEYKDEPLQIPDIILGFDKSERRGPER